MCRVVHSFVLWGAGGVDVRVWWEGAPLQVKFLKFLNAGQLRLARQIGVEALGDTADDFYSVLARAREEGAKMSSVFTGTAEGEDEEAAAAADAAAVAEDTVA